MISRIEKKIAAKDTTVTDAINILSPVSDWERNDFGDKNRYRSRAVKAAV